RWPRRRARPARASTRRNRSRSSVGISARRRVVGPRTRRGGRRWRSGRLRRQCGGRSRPLGTSGEGRCPGADLTAVCRSLSSQLPPDHLDRVVILVGDPFLERDDRVVGDLDVLRADLGAALRDVAITDPTLVLEMGRSIRRVDWVHLEAGASDEESRAHERPLGLVVPQHVADVLAEEALDALAELLDPLDVLLLPTPGLLW